MASLIKTINFIIVFFWTTSKIKILIVFVTLPIYLFEYDQFYKIVFSINCFFINLVMACSLFKTDEYLRSNGFYKLLNISRVSVLISKSIIVFSSLSIHLGLLLLNSLNLPFEVFLVLNILMLLFFIYNILFIKIKGKVISVSILLLLLSICFLTCDVFKILLFMILLLVISVWSLLKSYYHNITSLA